MCGDICTRKEHTCTCGSVILSYADHTHYCCLPPEEVCSSNGYNSSCPGGQAMHKSQSCLGVCHDDTNPPHETEASVAAHTCDYTPKCLTVAGDLGKPCIFPFTFQGATFIFCAERQGEHICATKVGEHASISTHIYTNLIFVKVDTYGELEQWGVCSPNCMISPGGECWSQSAGVVAGYCSHGTQCAAWLPNTGTGTWDGTSPLYCLHTPPLQHMQQCDYDLRIGPCGPGLLCKNGVCAKSDKYDLSKWRKQINRYNFSKV